MDNIAIEAYALCCLLPLLAFLLLTLQFYCQHSHKTHIATIHGLHEETSYSFEGLISITQQLTQHHTSTACVALSCEGFQTSCEKSKDPAEETPFSQSRLQKSCLSQRMLNNCAVGLARMHQINKVYFRSKGLAKQAISGKLLKRKRVNSYMKQSFEATRLVTIIEGLQY